MRPKSKPHLYSLCSDTRGVAAIEFAVVAPIIVLGLLNAVDMGRYEFQRMVVRNAAQVGAQNAWKTCSSSALLPATVNCPGMRSAITAAIQSTSLGTAVSLISGYPTEGYYCVNSSNVLQLVGSVSNSPANCSVTGNAGVAPGDYIELRVTFSYAPLFHGVTVMSTWGTMSITAASWMRLG